MNSETLRTIIERASTLHERRPDASPPYEGVVSHLVARRCAAWRQLVAPGDEVQFQRRLALDGWDAETLARALGPPAGRMDFPLPAWAVTLQAVMAAAAAEPLPDRCLDPAAPLPFEELWLPFVTAARARVRAEAQGLLTAAAHAQLERHLLRQLATVGAKTLQFEFSIFRTKRRPLFAPVAPPESPSRKLYDTFVSEMRAGGWEGFFSEYSALARLLATATDQWVAATGEFLERLAADGESLAERLVGAWGPVVAAEAGISDPHAEGRTVIALTFTGGARVIYKPRDLGIEVAWFEFLAALNAWGAPLDFHVLRVLARERYGWVEFAPHATCPDVEAARRFYRRAGALLCVAHVLAATDCHRENLVAAGEFPVLVDLETLLQPQLAEATEEGGAQLLANLQLANSVMNTGLLPSWDLNPNGEGFDASGLGAVAGGGGRFRVPQWRHVNTDAMASVLETVHATPLANVPTLDGTPLVPNDFLDEIVTGFRATGHFLVAHREALLACDGPLGRLAGQRVRFVFRGTKIYAALLQKSFEPAALREGVERSLRWEPLARAFLQGEATPPLWPLLHAEQAALEQLDVPAFTARTDSRTLVLDGVPPLLDCFAEPSHALAVRRLQSLSEPELERQIGFIRAAFYSRGAGAETTPHPPPPRVTSLLSDAELIAEAGRIVTALQERAICGADGSVTWLGVAFSAEAQRFHLQPMGYSLYDGSGGVALFLAAWARVTGNLDARRFALAAFQPLRRALGGSDAPRVARRLGIGGAVGLGSVVYVLAQGGELLEEPALWEDAHRVAALLTPEAIANDTQLDVVSGTAGTILGLLALHARTPDTRLLARATCAGEHLLTQRVTSSTGPRAWPTGRGQLLGGFSHGVAGIALALLRLGAATHEATFREAALEAIAYEGTLFSEEAHNWADLRTDPPAFQLNWCNGAAGIGLGRLGGLRVVETPEARQALEAALATTAAGDLQPVDHLCCGNLGRVELLIAAAQLLQRPALFDMARKQLAVVVRRAQQLGGYRFFANLPLDAYNPGFFQGSAGIGYTLLRVAHPTLLPSVLLWE